MRLVRRGAPWCLRSWLVVAVLLAVGGTATADEALSRLSGVVLDTGSGGPVEGALVLIAGPNGLEQTVKTDRAGRYAAVVHGGTFSVVFVYGAERSSGRVVVQPGIAAVLDGRIDASSGEVIVIRERLRPPVPPKPTNFKPLKAPPYSDRAIMSDAWTRAWMLIDLDERGRILRFKFLKRPGYDLEKIAVSEIRKLKFEPARDATGTPIRSWLLWSIEWPSAWWLAMFTGTRTAMPKMVGFPPRRQDAHVPCAGSGPLHLGSLHPVYKDCSQPDLSKAASEPWILP